MKFQKTKAWLGPVVGLVFLTVEAQASSVHEIMESMDKHFSQMKSSLAASKDTRPMEPEFDALRDLFTELKGAYDTRYGGTKEGWNGYCEQSLTVLEEI